MNPVALLKTIDDITINAAEAIRLLCELFKNNPPFNQLLM
jgi:hypothetical protein